MKKIINLLLALMLLVSLSACNKKNNDTSSTEETDQKEVVGGHVLCDSPIVTDEIKTLVEKATGDLVGATYEPVINVASQVVYGTNYLVLCKQTIVTATPITKYVLITIHEDLNGNVELAGVKETSLSLAGEDLLGGWQESESPVLTDETKEIFTKATADLVGCNYNPIALLSTQIVSGTNYCYFCEITPVTPDAETYYGLVYVYEDLNGDVTISDVVDFDVMETDDGGSIVYYDSIEKLNNELDSRFAKADANVEDETFFVYNNADGSKIGEYDYKLDGHYYQVRFSSDFKTTDVVGVVTNNEELFSDPDADDFKNFTVKNAMIFYIAHWLTIDGQYAMIVDTNNLSEEDFTAIAQNYHDATVATNS